jgi:type IV pilus assembly protein PilA
MLGEMRRSGDQRAFTLVELMVVVALVGILAAIAVYGVNRYLSAAKSSEAKQAVGDISRAAHAVYQREAAPSELVAEGTESTAVGRQLCGSAVAVPGTVPAGRKYQPRGADGQDFQTGDAYSGWKCLRFYISTPFLHQYHYTKDGGTVAAGSSIECTGSCYEAGALGDIDGDSVYSRIARTGHIHPTTRELRASTTLHVENEYE